MSSAVRRALRAMDDENLDGCGQGLREAVDAARLAGNAGMAGWFDALGALVDAERDRRAGRPRGALPALSDRLAGLTHGELLTLAMQATLDPPRWTRPPGARCWKRWRRCSTASAAGGWRRDRPADASPGRRYRGPGSELIYPLVRCAMRARRRRHHGARRFSVASLSNCAMRVWICCVLPRSSLSAIIRPRSGSGSQRLVGLRLM